MYTNRPLKGLAKSVADPSSLLDMYSATPGFRTVTPSVDLGISRRYPKRVFLPRLDMNSYEPGFPATIKSLGMKGVRSPSYTKLSGLAQDTTTAYDASGNPIGVTQSFVDASGNPVTPTTFDASGNPVVASPAPAAGTGFWDSVANIFKGAATLAPAATQLVRTATGQYVVPGGAGMPTALNAQYSPSVAVGLSSNTQKLLMYGALGLGALFLISRKRR